MYDVNNQQHSRLGTARRSGRPNLSSKPQTRALVVCLTESCGEATNALVQLTERHADSLLSPSACVRVTNLVLVAVVEHDRPTRLVVEHLIRQAHGVVATGQLWWNKSRMRGSATAYFFVTSDGRKYNRLDK